MRKKELLQKNAELTVMLHDCQFENSFLKNEIKECRNQFKELENQLEELKKQSVQVQEQSVTVVEEAVIAEESKEDIIISAKALDTELPFGIEYGSSVIGELVISAAKYADELSKDGEKNRELINLILGRTEVEKANILGIVSSEASDDDKKKMIDSCRLACEEYFDSVMAQRCDA